MKTDEPELRVDRTVLTVARLGETDDQHWWSKTPQERLEATEIQRRILYGYATPPRLQRVLEVVRR